MVKLNFQDSFIQFSESHDPSEIIALLLKKQFKTV